MGLLFPLVMDTTNPEDADLDEYLGELDDQINSAGGSAGETYLNHGDDKKVTALSSVENRPTHRRVLKPTAQSMPSTAFLMEGGLSKTSKETEIQLNFEAPLVPMAWPPLPDLADDRMFDREQLSYWVHEASKQEYITEGLTPAQSITLITGESGEGKSPYVYQQALSVALGIPHLGRNVKQGPVVIFDAENGVIQGHQLIEQLTKHLGAEACAAPPWKYWNMNAMADDFGKSGHTFEDYIRQACPVLVVLDPIYAFYTEIEADAQHATAAYRRMRKLMAETGCAIIGVCHLRKSPTKKADKFPPLEKLPNASSYFQQVRGSSAMINGCDVRLAVAKPVSNTGAALIVREFARLTGELPTIFLNRVLDADGEPQGYSLAAGPDPFKNDHERTAYIALPDPPDTFRYRDIETIYGSNSGSVTKKFVSRMLQSGLLIKLPQRHGYVKGKGTAHKGEGSRPDA